MLYDKKIFQNDLKVIRASDYSRRGFGKTGAGFLTKNSTLNEAIENADGVPFHLIFGQKPGEGYYVNAGAVFRQLLGIESGDLTEKHFLEMIEEVIPLYENIPPDIYTTREKFIKGEIKKYKAEILIRTPSGEKKWIRDTSLPLWDEETGKVIGSVGILFDITDTKNYMFSLAIANEKAKENEDLKSAFLRNLSHEVRTPLNAIIGFSNLICEPDQDLYGKREYLDIINNSADHLLDMMNNIFEISYLDSNGVEVEISRVKIHNILQEIFIRFGKQAGDKDLQFRFEPDMKVPSIDIETDEMKLVQIISCLVSNAIKFTKTGSVWFGYILKDDFVEFYVGDTGVGIRDEYKPHIFSRFYQAESGPARSYPGIGLGLAISKAYVELLGGSIWFASELDKGSEFRVRLPVR